MKLTNKNLLILCAISTAVALIFSMQYDRKGHQCCGGCSHHQHKASHELVNEQVLLIDQEGNSSQALNELLELTGIIHDGTLESIVTQTQKEWIRTAGKERWEIEEKFPEKREQALSFLQQLGLLQEVKPQHDHYDYAFLLGATVQRVRLRFAYLINLFNQGVHFDNIIMLGGARPLDPTLENAQELLNITSGQLPIKKDWKLKGDLPKTEYEMMKMVYEQAELPEGFVQIPIEFINTPMQQNQDGSLRRPSTADTIATFLAQKPKPGTCLFISSNPFVGYQDAVARTYFPDEFKVETVGSAAPADTKISVHLDNLARWLYQEKIIRDKKNCTAHV